jgi:hypothetical protein
MCLRVLARTPPREGIVRGAQQRRPEAELARDDERILRCNCVCVREHIHEVSLQSARVTHLLERFKRYKEIYFPGGVNRLAESRSARRSREGRGRSREAPASVAKGRAGVAKRPAGVRPPLAPRRPSPPPAAPRRPSLPRSSSVSPPAWVAPCPKEERDRYGVASLA